MPGQLMLAAILRQAYATAGQGSLPRPDVFEHMAAAVEAHYGPMIERRLVQQHGDWLVIAETTIGDNVRSCTRMVRQWQRGSVNNVLEMTAARAEIVLRADIGHHHWPIHTETGDTP